MKEVFVSKNDTERLRIGSAMYNDHEYLDIRIQFQNKEGKWLFTSKGATLPLSKIAELKEAVSKL